MRISSSRSWGGGLHGAMGRGRAGGSVKGPRGHLLGHQHENKRCPCWHADQCPHGGLVAMHVSATRKPIKERKKDFHHLICGAFLHGPPSGATVNGKHLTPASAPKPAPKPHRTPLSPPFRCHRERGAPHSGFGSETTAQPGPHRLRRKDVSLPAPSRQPGIRRRSPRTARSR